MNLTISLSDDKTAALTAKASARGLSAEDYARQVLEQDLAPEWLQRENAAHSGLNQLSTEEIDAEIDAARRARRKSQVQPGS
jgi:plasmid stability protein